MGSKMGRAGGGRREGMFDCGDGRKEEMDKGARKGGESVDD